MDDLDLGLPRLTLAVDELDLGGPGPLMTLTLGDFGCG
jgi:hypothetical protein